MKSNLVVMVGPPGCGKTTFIKNQPLKGNHISRDKIRFSLLEDGETYFGKEDLVFKEYVKQLVDSGVVASFKDPQAMLNAYQGGKN